MSNKVDTIPSRIPICDPNPNDNNMAKNNKLQNGDPGNFVKTSAITIKAKPVPPAAALSSFSRLQFLSWLEILLKTCELIKPVYSSTVMSSAVLLGQKLVVERMIATSL